MLASEHPDRRVGMAGQAVQVDNSSGERTERCSPGRDVGASRVFVWDDALASSPRTCLAARSDLLT